MTFLEKLDVLIKSKGLNKHSFARECGIPYTTIDYWYRQNTDNVKLETLRQISGFFGVTLNYWKNNETDALTVYQKYVDFLPYLAQADESILKSIRILLGMPLIPDEKKENGSSTSKAIS